MPAHRRANYIQLTSDRQRLDYMNTKYADIKFAIPAVKEIVITDAFEGNLPGLAYKLWGDPDYGYWWVLGLFNGIIDPLEDIVKNTKILVPNIDDVKKFLATVPDEGLATTNVVTL